ncbi:hypothetical protein HDV00_012578 [Rhizophlyctis rosea]|nr:hypothetical protein HDV00_012578 [Rhizophlyctis rosea]
MEKAARGADMSQQKHPFWAFWNQKRTPFPEFVLSVSERGQSEIVQRSFEMRLSSRAVREKDAVERWREDLAGCGKALLRACELGHADIVRYLLELGVEKASEIESLELVEMAISNGHIGVLETLLEFFPEYLGMEETAIDIHLYLMSLSLSGGRMDLRMARYLCGKGLVGERYVEEVVEKERRRAEGRGGCCGGCREWMEARRGCGPRPPNRKLQRVLGRTLTDPIAAAVDDEHAHAQVE